MRLGYIISGIVVALVVTGCTGDSSEAVPSDQPEVVVTTSPFPSQTTQPTFVDPNDACQLLTQQDVSEVMNEPHELSVSSQSIERELEGGGFGSLCSYLGEVSGSIVHLDVLMHDDINEAWETIRLREEELGSVGFFEEVPGIAERGMLRADGEGVAVVLHVQDGDVILQLGVNDDGGLDANRQRLMDLAFIALGRR